MRSHLGDSTTARRSEEELPPIGRPCRSLAARPCDVEGSRSISYHDAHAAPVVHGRRRLPLLSSSFHEADMHIARCSRRRPILSWFAVVALIAGAVPAIATPAQDAALRPMTFMDVQEFARPGSWTPSPDGEWMLYTISTPDWQEAESQSDIFLVSMTEGLVSTRQMTFTEGFNETAPQWGRDGSFFVFLSDREASGRGERGGREGRGERDDRGAEGSRNQMYLMRPDGGEARRISDADSGVADFSFSPDGARLVFRSGESGHEQAGRIIFHLLELF